MTNPPLNVDELVPLVPPHDGQYKRNFTSQVVCELRFPTLLSLSAAQPPKAFVSALRKQYPILELGKEMMLGSGEPPIHSHIVKSAKGTWVVTLKREALSIEATRYTNYKDMRARIVDVLDAVVPLIDSDFFTRLGLRYVNVVTTDGSTPLSEWINPMLVGPIVNATFQGVSEMAGRVRLQADGGGCFLQHGLRHKDLGPKAEPGVSPVPDYILDIDTYREEVPVAEALEVLDKMRLQAYSLFEWALGQRARATLLAEKK